MLFTVTRDDKDMVARLRRLNPFGGYRLPRNEREREILHRTLANYEARAKPASFKPGDRVEFAPHTDRWMRGDRYAVVVKLTANTLYRVRCDKSGDTINVLPSIIKKV